MIARLFLGTLALALPTVVILWRNWFVAGRPEPLSWRLAVLGAVIPASIGILYGTAGLLSEYPETRLVGLFVAIASAAFLYSRPVVRYWAHISHDTHPAQKLLTALALGAIPVVALLATLLILACAAWVVGYAPWVR